MLLLEKRLKQTGYSKAAYIRALIMGLIPKAAPTPDYQRMMKELRAIGNSMNQIAARANAIGFIDANTYRENAQTLWAVLLELQHTFLPEKINGNNKHVED